MGRQTHITPPSPSHSCTVSHSCLLPLTRQHMHEAGHHSRQSQSVQAGCACVGMLPICCVRRPFERVSDCSWRLALRSPTHPPHTHTHAHTQSCTARWAPWLGCQTAAWAWWACAAAAWRPSLLRAVCACWRTLRGRACRSRACARRSRRPSWRTDGSLVRGLIPMHASLLPHVTSQLLTCRRREGVGCAEPTTNALTPPAAAACSRAAARLPPGTCLWLDQREWPPRPVSCKPCRASQACLTLVLCPVLLLVWPPHTHTHTHAGPQRCASCPARAMCNHTVGGV
jgi:hypothetical protein